MKKQLKNIIPNLRQKAEDVLRNKSSVKTAAHLSEAEALKLIHELEVYEIELEMQNEEFSIAKEMYSKTLKLTQEHDLQQIEMQMQNELLLLAHSEAKEIAKQYAEFYNNAASGFFTLSNTGEILELNLFAAKLLGKDKAQLIKVRFGFFVSELTKPIFNQFLVNVLELLEKQTCEVEIVTADNSRVFCQITGIASQNTDKCLLTVTDISEIKRSEDALMESECWLQTIVENQPECIKVVDAQGILLHMNSAGLDLIEADSIYQVLGLSIFNIIAPESRDMYESLHKRVIAGESVQLEFEVLGLKGMRRLLETKAVPMNYHGKIVQLAITRDITLRKKTEKLMKESLERLQKIASCVPGVVYQYRFRPDGTSCFPFASDAINNIYHVTPAEVMEDASKVFERIHPEDIEGLAASIQYSADNLTNWRYEYRVKFEDNTIRYLYGDSIPQLEEDGSILWHGYISDITERKLADEKLQVVEQQYRDMFEKNSAVKLVIDPTTGAILNANIAAEIFYGYSIDSLLHMNIDEINMLDKKEIVAKMLIAKDANSECFQFQHRLASGDIRDVEVYSGPIEVNKRIVLHSIIHDVTERIKAEQELRNVNWRLESIVEGAHVGTWEWNIQTGETIFNNEWAKIIGYTLDELAPLSIDIWLKMTHPADLILSNELLNKHFTGELPHYELECRMKHKDGHWVWIRDCGRVITRTEDGKPLMMFGTHTDISDRKRTEESLIITQEEMKKFAAHLQNVREEERILLAREIHDELAQTLIAIKIDLGMLKQKILNNVDNVDINIILTKFDQLFGLVDNTIKTTGSIMTDLRPEALYLLGLVEAISLYTSRYEAKHNIICRFENSISDIFIKSQCSVALFYIFQEALTNVALHAKATSVEIHLRLEMNTLIMEIIDNGIGFDEDKLIKKETYGLIGMKERALFIGGKMTVASQSGKGTNIKVEMPNSFQIVVNPTN